MVFWSMTGVEMGVNWEGLGFGVYIVFVYDEF